MTYHPPTSTSAASALKLVTKLHPRLTPAERAALYAQHERRSANAPQSVESIPASGNIRGAGPYQLTTPYTPKDHDTAGAVVRNVGNTRRVFLLRPTLTPMELHGLAYRIDVLNRNPGITSVLIATSDDDDVENACMPTDVVEDTRTNDCAIVDIGINDAGPGQVWWCHSGYDPVELRSDYLDQNKNEGVVTEALEGVRKLALATRGSPSTSKVPTVTIPHGLVTDSGYALCLSSYVLATSQTRFEIRNPSRGLSLDPVGLSYILPRLGWEYNQPAAAYPGCGWILALAGWQADGHDLVNTGLATHYLDGSQHKLGTLERNLGNLKSWERQTILQTPTVRHGHELDDAAVWDYDVNAEFKNVAVSNLLRTFTAYNAAGIELGSTDIDAPEGDPSLVYGEDRLRYHGEMESDLVNVAATFDGVFQPREGGGSGGSVEGMLDGLRQIARRASSSSNRGGRGRSNQGRRNIGDNDGMDADDRLVCQIASDLVTSMERRSPLALKTIHRLLTLGARDDETIESCMERELNVQSKLIQMDGGDFARWIEATDGGAKGDDQLMFRSWKHTSLNEVTDDEVEELLQD